MAVAERRVVAVTSEEIRRSLLRDAADPAYMARIQAALKQADEYVQSLDNTKSK
jgi:hypothetical protein